jgi:hypothetical protein
MIVFGQQLLIKYEVSKLCIYVIFYICSTYQIENALKRYREFRGVYSMDKVPDYLLNGGYVINTQSANLPGEHWLAVHVTSDLIQVFDPLGMYYPSTLVTKLERMQQPVRYNDVMYQNPLTFLCGNYCVDWLKRQLL